MNQGARRRPHSSTTFGVRNEDTQPNEDIYKRVSKAPPVLQPAEKLPVHRKGREWKQQLQGRGKESNTATSMNRPRHQLPPKPMTGPPTGGVTSTGVQNGAGPSTVPKAVPISAPVSSHKPKSVGSTQTTKSSSLKRQRPSKPQPNSRPPSSNAIDLSHEAHPSKRQKLQSAANHPSPPTTSVSSTRSEHPVRIKNERELPTPLPHQTRAKTPPPSRALKHEPDLSPAIPSPPKPRTSGTKFYPGLPATLRTGHPDCTENRNAWIKRTKAEVTGRIRFHRVLFRQDGICIDWSSKVQRMPDTLEPFYEPVEDDEVDIVEPRSEGGVQEATSSSVPMLQLPSPVEASFSALEHHTAGVEEVHIPVEANPPSVPMLEPPSPVEPTIPTVSDRALSYESVPQLPTLEDLDSPMSPEQAVVETVVNVDGLYADAEVFLERYIKAFDKDRSSLGSAYSPLCTLSCKVHRPTRAVRGYESTEPIQELFSSIELGIKDGRLDVLSALLSIDPRFRFCPPRSKRFDLDFDMGWDCIVGKVRLSCYGELLYDTQRVGIDMSFVLGETEDEGNGNGLWPLVVIAQSITVRDIRTFSS